MKTLLALTILTLALAGCDTTNCPGYKDQATCVSDKACHWNENEKVCKS